MIPRTRASSFISAAKGTDLKPQGRSDTARLASAAQSGPVVPHSPEDAILAAQSRSEPMRPVTNSFRRSRADRAFIWLDSRIARNSLAFCCLLGATATASACSEQSLPLSGISLAQGEESQPVPEHETTEPARQTVAITGVRVTQGNAVDCPQLRDDAGTIHVVSYLSPAAPIGTRVTVRGFYGITTKCLGTVVVVEEEVILSD